MHLNDLHENRLEVLEREGGEAEADQFLLGRLAELLELGQLRPVCGQVLQVAVGERPEEAVSVWTDAPNAFVFGGQVFNFVVVHGVARVLCVQH